MPKDSISKPTISEIPEMTTKEQSQLNTLNEWGVEKEQRIKFDKERHIYVFTETLRPVILSNQDQICHLPSLTYYAVSTPRYIYYEVENAQERPGGNMLYNIDIEIEHPVVSITRVKEMYSESIDQFPYIIPSTVPSVSELTSPYWTERREEVTDEHLVTLGKYQQQFLGSLNPKREIEPEPVKKALVNKEREEGDPKFQGSKSSEKNDREELIQSLIRSNGQLVNDVAFLKKRVKEMANKHHEAYSRAQENLENPDGMPVGWPKAVRDKIQVRGLHLNDKDKEYDNQYDIRRQVQLAIHLKEEEKQLKELKERSRQELLEQQKQRDKLQQEKLNIERAIQASLEDEKRKLE